MWWYKQLKNTINIITHPSKGYVQYLSIMTAIIAILLCWFFLTILGSIFTSWWGEHPNHEEIEIDEFFSLWIFDWIMYGVVSVIVFIQTFIFTKLGLILLQDRYTFKKYIQEHKKNMQAKSPEAFIKYWPYILSLISFFMCASLMGLEFIFYIVCEVDYLGSELWEGNLVNYLMGRQVFKIIALPILMFTQTMVFTKMGLVLLKDRYTHKDYLQNIK